MDIAKAVSARSIDPRTKHGSVAVDFDNNILATGYNSPPRGMDDTSVPLTAPEKYHYFVHSEEALICNAARVGASLKGCRVYVTGFPCPKCFRMMVNAGISEVVYGDTYSHCVGNEEMAIINNMLNNNSHNIRLRKFI